MGSQGPGEKEGAAWKGHPSLLLNLGLGTQVFPGQRNSLTNGGGGTGGDAESERVRPASFLPCDLSHRVRSWLKSGGRCSHNPHLRCGTKRGALIPESPAS